MTFCRVFFILAVYLLTVHLNLYIHEYQSNLLKKPDELYCLPVHCYLSLKNVVADCYWFSLLYAENLSADYLFDMANLITDLDPHFTVVFRYVGIYLTTQTQQNELAVRLLQKGLASSINCADWRIYFYLAHNYKYGFNDNQTAGFYYQQAAKQSSIHEPPKYLKSLGRHLIG